MDPLTSLIFMALICVGLAVWLFMLYSKNKNLLRYGSCLRCGVKLERLKIKLRRVQDKYLEEARRKNATKESAIKIARIAVRTLLPVPDIFPDIDWPLPDLDDLPIENVDINTLDINDILPEDYNFEELIDRIISELPISNYNLKSIDLEKLEAAEAQLDALSQELDEILANLSD